MTSRAPVFPMYTWPTKQGEHGTLYRYRMKYRDPNDPGFPESVWSCWAYNTIHAWELFHETADDGFEAVGEPVRVKRRVS